MDEYELKSKLRGYFNFPRSLIIDLATNNITPDQFTLFTVFLGLASWDSRGKNYATINTSNREISKILHWNRNKIGLNKGLLFGRKYIDLLNGKNRQLKIRINNPELFYSKITGEVSKTRATKVNPRPT